MFNPQLELHLDNFSPESDDKKTEDDIVKLDSTGDRHRQWYDRFFKPTDWWKPVVVCLAIFAWRRHAATISLQMENFVQIFLGSVSVHLSCFLLGVAASLAMTKSYHHVMRMHRPNQDRLRINTLLGSIEAPPLAHYHLEETRHCDVSHLVALVEAYVDLLNTIREAMATLRWATALRWGRASSGLIIDRLERGRSNLIQNGHALPGRRLRRAMHQQLAWHQQCLAAIARGDDIRNLLVDHEKEPSNQEPVITLASLGQDCGDLACVLSSAVQHLWQSDVTQQSVTNVQFLLQQALESQAYFGSWKMVCSGDNTTSHQRLVEFQTTVATLHDALQGLRLLHFEDNETVSSREWETCQRIAHKLWRQYSALDERFVVAMDDPQVHDDTPEPTEDDPPTAPGEHREFFVADAPAPQPTKPTSREIDSSSVLVFSGQGTMPQNTLPLRRPTSGNSDVPFYPSLGCEQSLLEELRRHLKNLPTMKEVEVGLDTDQLVEPEGSDTDVPKDRESSDAGVRPMPMLVVNELQQMLQSSLEQRGGDITIE